MLDKSQLREMSQVEIEKIDPDTLVNISAVSIDPTLPYVEKIERYIEQIKNPYCFISGKTPVKINYVRPDRTLSQSLGNYLKRLQQK